MNRDGRFPETGLRQSWDGAPPLAWTTHGLGSGFSSVSVVGDTIYAAGMLAGNQGYVFLIDLDGEDRLVSVAKLAERDDEIDDETVPVQTETPETVN